MYETCSVSDGWLQFRGAVSRTYPRQSRKELPSAFARHCAAGEAGIRKFALLYGRLGFWELASAAPEAVVTANWPDWRPTPATRLDEPIVWIAAHARTVDWCLSAGFLLQSGVRSTPFRDTWEQLPKPQARGLVIADLQVPDTGGGNLTYRDRVGLALSELLEANTKSVSPRLCVRGKRIQAHRVRRVCVG